MKSFLIFLTIFLFINSQTYFQRIDDLNQKLIENPNDIQSQLTLIKVYLESAEPELAFLELLESEGSDYDVIKKGFKGKVHLYLNQIEEAKKELLKSYIVTGDVKFLLNLSIILNYLNDENKLTFVLQQLKKKNLNLVIYYKKEYERLFVLGHRLLANSTLQLLGKISPDKVNDLFPKPNITITNPQNNFITEKLTASINFNVSHTKPIKKITVIDNVKYEDDNLSFEDADKPFNKKFYEGLKLKKGNNSIVIEVKDMYNNVTVDSINIINISYVRDKSMKYDLTDSLNKYINLTLSYFSHLDPKVNKVDLNQTFYFEGNNTSQEKSVFMYDFLTNDLTSTFSISRSKFVVDSVANKESFELVTNSWLIKNLNFKTKTNIILSGDFEFLRDSTYLLSHNEKINLNDYFRSIFEIINSGYIITLIGNNSIDSLTFVDAFRPIIEDKKFPINIAYFQKDNLDHSMINHFYNPNLLNDSIHLSDFTLAGLADLSENSYFISNSDTLDIGINVNKLIFVKQQEYLSQAMDKINKLKKSEQENLLNYLQNWKNQFVLYRFISNSISLEELKIRVIELEERNKNDQITF